MSIVRETELAYERILEDMKTRHKAERMEQSKLVTMWTLLVILVYMIN